MRRTELPAPVRLYAPAKVNLSLEILRRRSDGFYELATLMESVSIFDIIDLAPAGDLRVQHDTDINDEVDLVRRALERIEAESGLKLGLNVSLRKQIPIAAGLGGGSSDAGTVIRAVGDLLGLAGDEQHRIAASLGSDVPFFLHCGVALATGTGTDIKPLSTVGRRWYVILVPDLAIPGKTAALYGRLTPDDFSDGSRTLRFVERLNTAGTVQPDLLGNSFTRPLLEYDEVRTAREELTHAGAAVVLPSGAGPAVYTVLDSYQEAKRIAQVLANSGRTPLLATSVASNRSVFTE